MRKAYEIKWLGKESSTLWTQSLFSYSVKHLSYIFLTYRNRPFSYHLSSLDKAVYFFLKFSLRLTLLFSYLHFRKAESANTVSNELTSCIFQSDFVKWINAWPTETPKIRPITSFTIMPQSWGKLNFGEKNGPCPHISMRGGAGMKRRSVVAVVL